MSAMLHLPTRRVPMMGFSKEYYRRVMRLNPIAFWPLSEQSGTVAADLSGNGRVGAYTGVTFNVPGADIVVNGTFTADASWTKGAGWTIPTPVASHAALGGATSLTQANILVVGQTYTLTYTVSALTAGTITASLGATALTARGADGTYTESGVVTTTTTLGFAASNDCDGSIDNVVCSCSTANGIGDGKNAPYFDGTNDYVNAYSASLASAFNGAEGTLLAWARVRDAAVWADNTSRMVLRLEADSSNFVHIRKYSDNQLYWEYDGGGTLDYVGLATTPTGWSCLALTWSKSGDALKAYINGRQTGSTQTGIGVWAGALAATKTVLGASNTTPAIVWAGTIYGVQVYNRALSSAEIASVSVV